jgi:Mor family transcriptional regulator
VKTDTEDLQNVPAKEENNAMLLQGELAEGLRTCTGLKESIANDWARQLVDYLRERLGAQEIYIPCPSRPKRDAAIVREFDGTNAADLMRRYGISRRRLYQIVESHRALTRAALESSKSAISPLKTAQDRA